MNYKGDLDDGCNIGSPLGNVKYAGLKQHEFNSTVTNYIMTSYSSTPQATFPLPQYSSTFWAGIDCSGLVQRSINSADALQISGASSKVRALNDNGGGSVWSQDLVSNSYTYGMPYDAQNEEQSLAKIRKGDFVRYPSHISIVYSEKPTCLPSEEDDEPTVCAYKIIHAYGGECTEKDESGSCKPGKFARKVLVTKNKFKKFPSPTGFGRIKLWD